MSEMIDLVIEDTNEKMDGAVAHTRREMATIRTGRASSAFVEKLTVEAYGGRDEPPRAGNVRRS